MSQLFQDLRFAVRSFGRSPGFTAVAVVTLALGIGANAAIFSVLNAVVLRPLPFDEPERLVQVSARHPFSLLLLEEIGGRAQMMTLSGWTTRGLTLLADGPPRSLAVGVVSAGHFSLLGRPPALGRDFLAEDTEPGSNPVILSHGLWQDALGGDPEVIGRTIQLRGESGDLRTVVGVMPAGFQPLVPGARAWIPHVLDRGSHEYEDMYNLSLVGRLAPGNGVEAASDELQAIAGRLHEEMPDHMGEAQTQTLTVRPLLESVVAGVRTTMWILQAAVGMVLLVGCANVANLVLARASSRSGELAVRTALGAGRGRIVRQLLTESALLGALGGAAGLGLAQVLLDGLAASLPPGTPRAAEIGLDADTMVATAGFALIASLLFGLAPALRATGRGMFARLHDAGRGAEGDRSRLNGALVAGQIALSLVLVASAGLMLKTLWNLQQVDPGFRPERLLTMRLMPPATRYPDDEARQRYYDQVLEHVRAVAGVEAAGSIDVPPMKPGAIGLTYMAEDHQPQPGDKTYSSYRTVSMGYFGQMSIPVVAGRGFQISDRAGGVEVGILNRTMAERLWPGEDAVGKEIRWDPENAWFTVVGVVGDVKQAGLSAGSYDVIYRPYSQEAFRTDLHLMVRTAGAPAAMTGAVREALWSVDREVPIVDVATMTDVMRRSGRQRRFIASLLVAAGGLALLLAAVGVFGVMSYAVSRRTREFGIRMALGADASTVLRGVMSSGARTAAVGLALGLAGAVAATRALSSYLYEVDAADPFVLLAVAAILGTVAMLASWLPARRAASVDPMVALRDE